jgi:hypothetical protein
MAGGRTRELALLMATVAVTRYTFRSKYLYDIDSVNFALAIGHFNPSTHQPHPPGYFLYVWAARVLNHLFHDPNTTLVALSIAASCGAAWAIHTLTNEWFGRHAATFSGLIFLCSPLAWFHGTVALTYVVEAFLSALLGYMFWRIRQGGRIVPAAVMLGIAAGLRPSTLLFLGPLFLYALASVKPKARLIGVAVLTVTIFLWLLPMVYASGGWTVYTGALWSLWKMVPAKQTVLNSSILNSVARLLTIVFIFGLSFGSAAALPLYAVRSGTAIAPSQKRFIAVWLVPGLLFFTFVFLKFVNSGYLLVLFPPVCAWLGLLASRWYATTQMRRPLRISAVTLAAAMNVTIFLFAPVYCSYRAVRTFEAELAQIRQELPTVSPPGEALIIGFDSHSLGYRHAGYYLGDYVTVQYPEVLLAAGKRAFSMAHRDTWLASRLPSCGYRSFILFPLPAGDREYTDYVATVRAQFPVGDLRTIRVGHHEFVTGPMRDLPVLFPTTAAPCIGGLSSAPAVYSR